MAIHPHDERTYQIIGAAMEVHRILDRGLKEKLYCDGKKESVPNLRLIGGNF